MEQVAGEIHFGASVFHAYGQKPQGGKQKAADRKDKKPD
jgi:hypothetical protein